MKNVVVKERGSFLKPFDVFHSYRDEDEIVFFDSGKDFEGDGRYSFIGLNPFISLKGNTREYYKNGEMFQGDVLEEIKSILKEYRVVNDTDIPFVSGGMGYFSYDLGREFEVLPNEAEEDVNIPEVYYHFFDNVIIFDNLEKRMFISAMGVKKNAEDSIKEILKHLQRCTGRGVPKVENEIVFEKFSSNFGKEEYIEAVGKVRNYIKSGDVYIMNMTQRFQCDVSRESLDIYEDLRSINPSQFGGFMKLDGFEILSCSPERFLRVSEGVVDTRPIKGTRPRGKTPEEDNKNRQELICSEKDKSELLMIVDLERNDLSRVCKAGSVEVTELFEIEEYPTVFHLVSNIRGRLRDDKDVIDCVRGAFPGGSITGAPKIRAMEIIDELEKVRRNIYTGAIGYLGFDGNSDLNIVIRTIIIKDGKAYFGVGGGVTWESDEEFEYEETLHKAYALMRALSKEE